VCLAFPLSFPGQEAAGDVVRPLSTGSIGRPRAAKRQTKGGHCAVPGSSAAVPSGAGLSGRQETDVVDPKSCCAEVADSKELLIQELLMLGCVL